MRVPAGLCPVGGCARRPKCWNSSWRQPCGTRLSSCGGSKRISFWAPSQMGRRGKRRKFGAAQPRRISAGAIHSPRGFKKYGSPRGFAPWEDARGGQNAGIRAGGGLAGPDYRAAGVVRASLFGPHRRWDGKSDYLRIWKYIDADPAGWRENCYYTETEE